MQGARAIPPLLLVLYHYHEGHGYQHFRLFDVFVAKGYLWVEFFFALSGFVLIYVYAAAAAGDVDGRGLALLPEEPAGAALSGASGHAGACWAMMLAMRALAHAGGYVSVFDLAALSSRHRVWSGFVANLFLVQAWHVLPHLTWNGVAWFVSVEFFLCLIFPAYLWLSQRRHQARA